MDKLNQKVQDMNSITTSLLHKVDDLENRSRRNNLIIHGIEESDGETWEITENKVTDFIRSHLKVSLRGNVQRAHRLGRKGNDNKIRPAIICFSDWKDRDKVLSASVVLKGTSYFVNEDFSYEVREARRNLMRYARERRWINWKIRYNKLLYRNSTYVYDSEAKAVIRTRGDRQSQQEQHNMSGDLNAMNPISLEHKNNKP